MLNKLKDYKEDGFTIIEVMIVLAIAGLIMVVVFLAVPALQRSSRNTSRKTDATNMMSAVNEFQSNGGGALPASGAFGTQFAASMPTLGYYTTAANVQWNYSAAVRTTVPTAPTGTDSVTLFNYAKCSNATTATVTNATARSVVALYNVETANGTQQQCYES